jgi:hypothetical protein
MLAHEMAHLAYSDPPVFRGLAACAESAVLVTRITLWVGVATTALMCVLTLCLDISTGTEIGLMAGRQVATLAIALLTLTFIPLSRLIVKRHGGFIASLLELRADVVAAACSGGLADFAGTVRDANVRKSTIGDIGHSLMSPDLTHIAESERLALLTTPARLATPKLRYFAASLLLAFAMPLNIVTPYLATGGLNHLLMLGPVAALTFVIVAMTVSSGANVQVPWWRFVVLGAAACIAAALPRINLEAVSYLLIQLAMWPAGTDFGGEAPSWELFRNYLSMTAADLADKVWTAIGGPWVAASCLVASALIWCLWAIGRRARAGSMALLLPAAAAGLTTIAVSRDGVRDEFFEFLPLSTLPDLIEILGEQAWAAIWLPMLAAAGTAALVHGANFIVRRGGKGLAGNCGPRNERQR